MDLKTYTSEIESGASLAKKIRVPQSLISQWQGGSRQVPAERCPDIEKATGGKVTCEELRPDLADKWAYLRGTDRRRGDRRAGKGPGHG